MKAAQIGAALGAAAGLAETQAASNIPPAPGVVQRAII